MSIRTNNTLQSAMARAERVQTHQLEVLSQSFPRTAGLFYLVFSILSLVSFGLLIWVIVGFGKDFESDCDTPLKVWVMVDLSSTIAQTLTALIRYMKPEEPHQDASVRLHLTLKVLLVFLILFDFAWLGVGLSWIIRAETCDKSAPHLYPSLVWYILWGLGITVFILIDTVGFYTIMRRMMQEGVLRTSNGAPPDMINRLEEMPFEIESEYFKENPECCICLADFNESMEIRVTSCNHAFHKRCLQNWFKVNRTCPLCRLDLTQSLDQSKASDKSEIEIPNTDNNITQLNEESTTNEILC